MQKGTYFKQKNHNLNRCFTINKVQTAPASMTVRGCFGLGTAHNKVPDVLKKEKVDEIGFSSFPGVSF